MTLVIVVARAACEGTTLKPAQLTAANDTAGPKAMAKATAKVTGFLTVDLPMTR
jgi:hypothetical protein